MNPLPVILADLRSLRWVAIAVPLLVAVAVAVGVAIGAQERALRASSARAADDFDLIVGAPGSQTQLMLTTVYLQPEALSLIPGALLNDLAREPGVAAAAPIAFGDVVRGYPVVGTTRDFAARWGRLAPAAGRLFAADGEAVVGADVTLELGAEMTPSHLVGGRHPLLGVERADEAEHRHGGERYRVVGRLPHLGSPWDRAILVPIESVWQTHGLGTGHAAGEAALGPPFDAAAAPGVPAIVVKPRSVADAYVLRGRYRSSATMAFFPAEALVPLYRAMGDVRDIMVIASALNNGLILAAVTLLLLALAGLRRKRYAVLRALGAPPAYVLLAVWLGALLLLAAGCLAGLGAGFALTAALSGLVAARTGLALQVTIGWPDVAFVITLVALASMLALVPALASYRRPVAAALRQDG
jgi:putative ABC transport system permease protein